MAFTAEYIPQNPSEVELVRQLTVATHRLRRLDRIETAALSYRLRGPTGTRHQAATTMMEQYLGLSDTLESIQRARGRAERSFHRCYKELEARKARRLTPRTAPKELEIEVDTRHEPILQNKARSSLVEIQSHAPPE